jgi:hypothetical protein
MLDRGRDGIMPVGEGSGARVWYRPQIYHATHLNDVGMVAQPFGGALLRNLARRKDAWSEVNARAGAKAAFKHDILGVPPTVAPPLWRRF